MSTLPGSGVIPANIPQTSSSNSAGVSAANFQTISSVGTAARVVVSNNAQLTLNTSVGKLTLPTPKIPLSLESGKEISIKLNSETSPNLLDISAKYLKQRIALTPQQSQLVLQSITQNPANIASPVEIKASVVAIQSGSIQIRVNDEVLNLAVKTPQRYAVGQELKLKLSSGTLGWEAKISAGATQESLRLPPEDVVKVLGQQPANKSIELSRAGRQTIQPVLNKLTESQLPEQVPRIQLRNQDNRLVVQLDFGNKPIASVALEKAQLNQVKQHLQASSTEFAAIDRAIVPRSEPGKNEHEKLATEKITLTTKHSFKSTQENQPKDTNPLKTNIEGRRTTDISGSEKVTPNKVDEGRIASNLAMQKSHDITYKLLNGAIKGGTASELVKNIAETQKHFNQLDVNKVIPEIKISEQKLQQATKPAQEKQVASEPQSPKLSNSAQQILQTLKSLQSSSMPNIQELVIKNVEKLLVTLSSKAEPNPGIKSELSTNQLHHQAKDVLNALKGISEQVYRSSEAQWQKLAPALDEILKNLNVNEELKGFVKKQISLPNIEPGKASVSLPDAQSIRQLLQSPALPITPVSIISPPSGGLVAGLINLLQVSLASKLNRSNNELTEKIANSISNLVGGNSKSAGTAKNATAGVKEFSQIEQKHNLAKLLGDIVNQHSKQKLQNAERSLQGQEAFYYVLPFRQSEQHSSPELLITRDKPEDKEQQASSAENKAWLLTMKLPVGDLGELLTKTKVTEEAIKVDFYTSSESLKNIVSEHLPALKKRFDSLGLTLEIGRCERGNIPEHLAQNPYQILQTRA